MPLMAHHASGSWLLPVPLTLLLFVIAFVYLRGLRSSGRASRRELPPWRIASFLLGLALTGIASVSPLAELDHRFLTAHMIQHLLLLTIAPALILLGDPVRSLSRGLPQGSAQEALGTLFRSPPFQQLGGLLANPVVCWLAAAATLIVWHVPPIFALAMQSPALHIVEQLTFLAAGLMFWWPVIQPWPSVPIWPRWPILLYLFLATIPCDILSAYLTFCETVVYRNYLGLPGATETSVLRDQELAGSLMWTCVTILYLVPAALLTVRLLEKSSRGLLASAGKVEPNRSSPDSSRTA